MSSNAPAIALSSFKPQPIEAQFLHNPPGCGFFCHAPTLLETTNGDLLAAWYAYPEEESRDASLVLACKRADRTEWDPARRIFRPSQFSLGNPVLFQAPDGMLWLYFVALRGSYWNDAETYGSCSRDEGANWSSPRKLGRDKGTMLRHPPIPLGNGSLLLPVYDEPSRESFLLSSRPPYHDWREVHRFAGLPIIQPAVIRVGASTLALFFRPFSDVRRIWRSVSGDDGVSWSTPVRTDLPSPLTGLAAFTYRDGIAVVYNHTEEQRRYPLSIAVSDFTGVSWSRPWHLETIEYEVSYPSFLCDAGGWIRGVYSYNRRMIKYTSFPVDCLR
jgi:predicted neuraminidase